MKDNKSIDKVETKSTSMRINNEVINQLKDIRIDIIAEQRNDLTLSDTVQVLINKYKE